MKYERGKRRRTIGRIIIKHDSRKFTVTSLQQLHDLVHALRGDNVHSPPQASSTLVPNVSPPPPAISTPEAADSTFGSAFSTPVNQNQYKGSGTSSSLNKKKKKRHGRRF
ncbi:hypothetical protein M8J77_011388 [Diaphorina citri]|nr:hypothetical protein M8J77_011388 [Diaphorina citri]